MHHHISHRHTILGHSSWGEGYATFHDFEKAYDRFNWTYMCRVLVRGKKFHRLGSFSTTSGVRQGNPLSAFLFLMTIEFLALATRTAWHLDQWHDFHSWIILYRQLDTISGEIKKIIFCLIIRTMPCPHILNLTVMGPRNRSSIRAFRSARRKFIRWLFRFVAKVH